MFAMSPSILSFNFILVKGRFFGFLRQKKYAVLRVGIRLKLCKNFYFLFISFLTFLGHNRLFLGAIWGSKTVLESTHVVEQLSFSMIP